MLHTEKMSGHTCIDGSNLKKKAAHLQKYVRLKNNAETWKSAAHEKFGTL